LRAFGDLQARRAASSQLKYSRIPPRTANLLRTTAGADLSYVPEFSASLLANPGRFQVNRLQTWTAPNQCGTVRRCGQKGAGMSASTDQQNLKDIADTMVFPAQPITYPVTADPNADSSLPNDYTKNTYQFTVSAVSANSEGKDFFCFNIAALVSSANGLVHNDSEKRGWCLEQLTVSLQPVDAANFEIISPSQPETYEQTEQVTKGISYAFTGTVGYNKDGASASASAGLTYSDSVTYGVPDVAYENKSSGGVFDVQVNVRGPQMDKKPFTGGLDAPAPAGISTFQPAFGVIFWSDSNTRANADTQAFALTVTLVYVYEWTKTAISDPAVRHATCSQQFSFTVANPPAVQAT
jgi:hypothetical protein